MEGRFHTNVYQCISFIVILDCAKLWVSGGGLNLLLHIIDGENELNHGVANDLAWNKINSIVKLFDTRQGMSQKGDRFLEDAKLRINWSSVRGLRAERVFIQSVNGWSRASRSSALWGDHQIDTPLRRRHSANTTQTNDRDSDTVVYRLWSSSLEVKRFVIGNCAGKCRCEMGPSHDY